MTIACGTQVIAMFNDLLEARREKIVGQTSIVRQPRRREVMPIRIRRAAPDFLLHQAVNVLKVNRLHRLKLERRVEESRLVFRRERFKVLQAGAPDSRQLGVPAERFGDIAKRCRSRILPAAA
jgi:hypothetical protein